MIRIYKYTFFPLIWSGDLMHLPWPRFSVLMSLVYSFRLFFRFHLIPFVSHGHFTQEFWRIRVGYSLLTWCALCARKSDWIIRKAFGTSALRHEEMYNACVFHESVCWQQWHRLRDVHWQQKIIVIKSTNSNYGSTQNIERKINGFSNMIIHESTLEISDEV